MHGFPYPADLRGWTFGRLGVVAFHAPGSHGVSPTWLCACVCGAEHVVSRTSLVGGLTRSCGCLRREKSRERYIANMRRAHQRRSARVAAGAQDDAFRAPEGPVSPHANKPAPTWHGVQPALRSLADCLGMRPTFTPPLVGRVHVLHDDDDMEIAA